MQIPQDAVLLRIFIGEDEQCHHRPLYEAIVLKAREMHLAGATVIRGPLGFGHSSRLHTAKILRLSEDLPMIIEIVDGEEKVEAFLPILDGMIGSGLVTLEKVKVLRYGVTQQALSKPHSDSNSVDHGQSGAHGNPSGLARSAAGWVRLPGLFLHRRVHG